MRKVTDPREIAEMDNYIEEAAKIALESTCKKGKRGVVIVRDDQILGKGYNYQTIPENCNPCIREHIHDNKGRECGEIHAEKMAIEDALINGHAPLDGSRMYHIKIRGGEKIPSGLPSCKACGSDIVYNGIAEFVLLHDDGYTVYSGTEFNRLSHNFPE